MKIIEIRSAGPAVAEGPFQFYKEGSNETHQETAEGESQGEGEDETGDEFRRNEDDEDDDLLDSRSLGLDGRAREGRDRRGQYLPRGAEENSSAPPRRNRSRRHARTRARSRGDSAR